MKSIIFKPWLALALVFYTTSISFGQQTKPVESGYAPVNGIEVYYEIYGQGEPLVLLHGAFFTIEMNWGPLINELSKARKVIAIEFQGHGHSPYFGRAMDIETLAEDVRDVMDYLKVGKADVAGYSMGGSVAYQFAVQYPDRLNKLIIISATHKSAGWLPVANEGLEDLSPEIFDDSPLKTMYEAVAPDKTKWTDFLKLMLKFAGEKFDIGDAKIAKIKAPVLLIAGDNDGLDKIELMKTYQLFGGGISADMSPMPKSYLAIVPGQTHVSVMMETETLLKYMVDFLKD
ncbi:MAG: alpha/beta hydrolase [Saprospiraceae bacterium]|nr:alpha/beta hydrolase [Saprospiraceae bacterium]